MRRLSAALLLVVAALGCKKKTDQTAAQPAKDAAVAAAPADAAPPEKGENLSPAPIPQPATAGDCEKTGTYAAALLRVVALDRKVPNDKIDATEKALVAAFTESCNAEKWPAYLLDCVGGGRAEAFTWQRCMSRYPDALRVSWLAKVDAIIGKAGGTVTAPTEAPAPEGGVAFETLCETFVAEMARLEDCSGGTMYVPDFENVFVAARTAAVGGLIPKDQQDGLKKLCEKVTRQVRAVEATTCGATVR